MTFKSKLEETLIQLETGIIRRMGGRRVGGREVTVQDAIQAITSLIEEELELKEKDSYNQMCDSEYCTCWDEGRNDLRDEQIKKLKGE